MNKKKVILLVVSILGVIGIVFGLSYAWFTIVIQGQKVNTIKAGELTLSINETGDTLNITDAFPISEEEGLKGTATTFSLTNTSPKNLEYKLKLVYDEASCSSCKKIPSSAIRYSLTKDGATLDSANLRENNNILESGIINAKGTYEYSLKIWIDYDAGNEAMDAYFYGKLEIEAVQTNLVNATDESCFEFDSSTGTITKFICAPYVYDSQSYKGVPNTNSVNNITDVVVPRVIDGIKVTSIGSEAFRENQITSLVLPDGVTSISSYAFRDNQLTSLVIPDGTTSIGSQAFEANRITNLLIPNSVTNISPRAFNNNQLPDSQAFIYKRNSDGSQDQTKLIGYAGARRDSIVIPNHVLSIEILAFAGTYITSVTIPNSVTQIATLAFNYAKLTNVVIPESVKTIGDQAFQYNQLTSVTLSDGLTTIGSNAFCNNQLASLVIPDSVTRIGSNAFDHNQLISVKLPSNIIEIGNTVFGNNQLRNITIPSSVTKIATSAFIHNQLDEIIIPDSVTTIGSQAFMYNNLTNIVIPSSVKTIEYSAFKNNQLTNVVIKGKANKNSFISYPNSSPFGWASGYSDDNITWNG